MAQSAHNRYALGVDIGGSHVCSAVVDLATGQLCGEPHTDKVDAAAGARTIAGAWAANIRRTAAASGIGCIRCAGFAFPGPFDYERGISLIRGVRKFERIYGLDVAATLYPLLRECGTEEFRYVNDAAAFALGECLGGVADDAERVVALTLGTGDVIENFLHQEHPDRETERSNDPCPDKELRRQPPLLQIGDLNVLPETQKRHAGQRDRKQHPRQVVFGTARQPDSDDRRNDLQDDGYDQQYLFNHCRIAV